MASSLPAHLHLRRPADGVDTVALVRILPHFARLVSKQFSGVPNLSSLTFIRLATACGPRSPTSTSLKTAAERGVGVLALAELVAALHAISPNPAVHLMVLAVYALVRELRASWI